MRYFREMKRFISIPNQFKGVSVQGEELIFTIMIDKNASGFLTIFSKAEDLFSRLQAIHHKFKVLENTRSSQNESFQKTLFLFFVFTKKGFLSLLKALKYFVVQSNTVVKCLLLEILLPFVIFLR